MSGTAIKRLIWAILCLVFAFALFFYQALLTSLASWFFQVYSTSYFENSFKYDDFFISGNQLVIVKPQFKKGNFFSASQLNATFRLNFFKRRLEIDVDLVDPHWNFHSKNLTFEENFEKLFKTQEQWIKIIPRIRLKNGLISWNDERITHPRSLKFDLEFQPQEGGVIELHLAENSFFSLKSLKEEESITVKGKCQGIDCSSLLATARFFGLDCSQWSVSKGTLEGKIQAVFPKKQRPYLEGELYIDHLSFQNKNKGIEGNIGQARILLEKNEAAYPINEDKNSLDSSSSLEQADRPSFATIGRIDFLQPSSIKSRHSIDNASSWEISEITGRLHLDQMDEAKISLQAQVSVHPIQKNKTKLPSYNELIDWKQNLCDLLLFNRSNSRKKIKSIFAFEEKEKRATYSKWHLQGKANINAMRALDLDMNLICSAKGQSTGKIHLALNGLKSGTKIGQIRFEKLSYIECAFLQSLFSSFAPNFQEIELESGQFDGLVEADISELGIAEVRVKQFEAAALSSKFKSCNASCQFKQVRGYGRANLEREDFWQSFSAGLHLEDGNIQFENGKPLFPVNEIQAHLFIHNGEVDHSLVTLQIGGLKGKMDVEWGKYKQLLTFKLEGFADETAKLLPPLLQEGLNDHFHGNRLMVLANLKKMGNRLDLGGTFHIQKANTEQMDVIHFGCEFYRHHSGKGSNYYEPSGWFHAQELPLEKFLSPFIFRNNALRMSGRGELKGTFNERFLLVKYDADDLKIENEHLCITLPSVHSSMPGQLIGTHQIDLSTYDYLGHLPFQSASYYEKNKGIEFKDIQGTASFKNGSIKLSPIEAYCDGIYFSGGLDLDFADPLPGVFDLTVECPTLCGKVFQVRNLLSHIDPASLLNKIPLEGELNCRDRGMRLKFSFSAIDWDLSADFTGRITEGSLSMEEVDMALRGIYLDIDYHHGSQLLKFSDIQGTLLVGKPRKVEEYLLSGHHIYFDQITLPDHSVDFDVSIKNSQYELFRAVGYTKENRQGLKRIYLDQNLTHLSCIYPHVWNCTLKDWETIDNIQFRSKFDLGTVLQDLKTFRRTGLLFLSPGLVDKISQFLPVEGDTSLEISVHPDQMYSYNFQGSRIKQGDAKEHSGLLKGTKQGKKWMIEQLVWDDWEFSFELNQMSEKWRIPFFGLKVSNHLLLGLDGDLYQDKGLLIAKLNFCEVDFSFFDRFSAMQSLSAKWSPKGAVKATGEIEWNFLSSDPWESFKAALSAKTTGMSLRGFPIMVDDFFQLSLLSRTAPTSLDNDKSKVFSLLCFENVEIKVDQKSSLFIRKFDYPLSTGESQYLNAQFQIPHLQLKILSNNFQHHFSDVFNFSFNELFSEIKREGFLRGNLFFEKPFEAQPLIRLELDNGLYVIKKKEFDLKQPVIEISNEGLEFSAFTHHERFPFQIIGKTSWPSCEEGEIKLIGQGDSKALSICWNALPHEKFTLRSIVGEFCGCRINLRKNPEEKEKGDWMGMDGDIFFDIQRLSPFLSSEFLDSIQKLRLDAILALKGHFWFNPQKNTSLFHSTSFNGFLKSDNLKVKGYQLQNLEGDLQYIPGRLDVQNLYIIDPAVSIKMPYCTVIEGNRQEKWTFFSPSIIFKNFKLNLLKKIDGGDQNSSKFRSLIMKKIEFQNLKGDLNDGQTWNGEGDFHFLNSGRKNISHPLFAIPAEIILRLGLNPHVLNPVTGMIFFSLRGDRFYLTRFKDVYSEGRGSKFNLAEGPGPSWIDLDGNVSVNIRMKQYNIIFKIAELFTVTMQGNIKKKLRYSLQKQNKSSRKNHFQFSDQLPCKAPKPSIR